MKWKVPELTSENIFESILQKRHIDNPDSFLHPTIEDIPNHNNMYDIEKAALEIIRHIKDKKRIYIHGDFDVDGITATTLLWNYLYRVLGADVVPYIPKRLDEGYGLSEESVGNIIEAGGNLIITVDCGVKDIELVSKYADRINFIITDHHTLLSSTQADNFVDSKIVSEYLISEKALAVVHPKLGGSYPNTEICGANVAWKLVCAINEVADIKIDTSEYLIFAAMGTLCDIMPLKEENRIIVSKGLELMRKTQNKGLRALFNIAGVDITKANEYHIGYLIGPRLNASGRIGHALDAVRLLSTEHETKAIEMANKLNELNMERQQITEDSTNLAISRIDSMSSKIIFVHDDLWNEGIVGLIAGKISNKLYRPVFATTKSGDFIKGSARSNDIVNVTELLGEVSHLLERYGGHKSAAGFTLKYDNYSAFKLELIDLVEKEIKSSDLERQIDIEINTKTSLITSSLMENIERLAPFGRDNERPIFAFIGHTVKNIWEIGKEKKHLKFVISDGSSELTTTWFNHELDKLPVIGSKIDVCGQLNFNTWNGNTTIELNTKDAVIIK